MSQAVADLPDDVESLRAIIAAQAAELTEAALRLHSRDTLIEKLKAQLAALRRARFGASSEKVERTIEQLELALEDIEAAASETAPALPAKAESAKNKPARQPLPDHLPRLDEVERRFCDGISTGEIPSDFPVAARARQVINLARGLTMHAQLGAPRKELLKDAEEAADLVLLPRRRDAPREV
jgi:hypothetical protein